MSCGSPHDVECAEALLRVYEYLDGEMEGEDCTRIRLHVAECGPCLREFGIEEEVKTLISRCHPCDPAPGSLRSRVMATLQDAAALANQPAPTAPGTPQVLGGLTGGPGLTPPASPFGSTGSGLGPTSID